jgi:hypothetical protein
MVMLQESVEGFKSIGEDWDKGAADATVCSQCELKVVEYKNGGIM